MADDSVTRTEFDALLARVDKLDGGASEPTGPSRRNTITASTPTLTLSGSTYVLSGKITTLNAQAFTYLQLAVRGSGASDLAKSPGASLGAGETKTLTGSGTGSGTYTAWVAYSLDGSTWVDGPKLTFSVSAPKPSKPTNVATGTKLGLVGKSGLPFNSLVFRQSAADATAFGARRGVPMDGLMYFTPRQSWEDLNSYSGDQKAYVQAEFIVVRTLPHAPESEGTAMNSRGANDAYKAQQRALGKSIADAGMNVPTHVLRVDWESNGNWYKWSSQNGGAEPLKQSLINFVTNVRAGGATKVLFDLCFNKGPSQSGHDFDVFPGAEYIDVVGVDQYDMWGPAYSQNDWDAQNQKSPSVGTVAKFAASHGIMWSVDEGGNTHGDGNSSTYGQDNPLYWQFMHQSLVQLPGNAWHVTYDDRGAPATLMHDFASNPRSWEKYKQLWRPA